MKQLVEGELPRFAQLIGLNPEVCAKCGGCKRHVDFDDDKRGLFRDRSEGHAADCRESGRIISGRQPEEILLHGCEVVSLAKRGYPASRCWGKQGVHRTW